MADTIIEKKINEFPEATSLNDADIMIAQTTDSNPTTNKITINTLINKVKTWLLSVVPFSYIKNLTSDVQTQLNQLKINKADSSHTHTWSVITGKPNTYAPSTHTHDDRYYTESEINTKLAKTSIWIGWNSDWIIAKSVQAIECNSLVCIYGIIQIKAGLTAQSANLGSLGDVSYAPSIQCPFIFSIGGTITYGTVETNGKLNFNIPSVLSSNTWGRFDIVYYKNG